MKYMMIMLTMCVAIVIGYQQTSPNININNDSIHEVTVQAGDTLWDIAARNAQSNVDIREVVYAVKEINNITDSGALIPGSKIKVPVKNVSNVNNPVRSVDYWAQN